MTIETLALLVVVVAVLLLAGRVIFALANVLLIAFLIVLGLMLIFDLFSGGTALFQIASAIVAFVIGVAAFLKRRLEEQA